MGFLYKLYVWLKRRYDPRTGPEMTLGLELNNTYIQSNSFVLARLGQDIRKTRTRFIQTIQQISAGNYKEAGQ